MEAVQYSPIGSTDSLSPTPRASEPHLFSTLFQKNVNAQKNVDVKGKFVARIFGPRTVHLYNVSTGEEFELASPERCKKVYLSTQGILTVQEMMGMRLWDLRSNTPKYISFLSIHRSPQWPYQEENFCVDRQTGKVALFKKEGVEIIQGDGTSVSKNITFDPQSLEKLVIFFIQNHVIWIHPFSGEITSYSDEKNTQVSFFLKGQFIEATTDGGLLAVHLVVDHDYYEKKVLIIDPKNLNQICHFPVKKTGHFSDPFRHFKIINKTVHVWEKSRFLYIFTIPDYQVTRSIEISGTSIDTSENYVVIAYQKTIEITDLVSKQCLCKFEAENNIEELFFHENPLYLVARFNAKSPLWETQVWKGDTLIPPQTTWDKITGFFSTKPTPPKVIKTKKSSEHVPLIYPECLMHGDNDKNAFPRLFWEQQLQIAENSPAFLPLLKPLTDQQKQIKKEKILHYFSKISNMQNRVSYLKDWTTYAYDFSWIFCAEFRPILTEYLKSSSHCTQWICALSDLNPKEIEETLKLCPTSYAPTKELFALFSWRKQTALCKFLQPDYVIFLNPSSPEEQQEKLEILKNYIQSVSCPAEKHARLERIKPLPEEMAEWAIESLEDLSNQHFPL